MGRYTDVLVALYRELQELGDGLKTLMERVEDLREELRELREALEEADVIPRPQAPRDVCPICGAFLWEDDDGRLICPRHGLVRFKC